MFSSTLFLLVPAWLSLFLRAGVVLADGSNSIPVDRIHAPRAGVCSLDVESKSRCKSNTLSHDAYCKVWLNYCNPAKSLENARDREIYATYCRDVNKDCGGFKPKDGTSSSGAARGHRRRFDSLSIRADSAGNPTAGNLNVSTADDVWYAVEITLGGQNFTVQLDTGSSDLWLFTADRPVQLTNTTDLVTSETYGKRRVQGSIQFAELQIGDFTINSQAFLQVIDVHDFDLTRYDGILGMAFDVGPIYNKVQEEWGPSAANAYALPPMSALFAQNASLPNNFDVQLSRPAAELDDTADGLFVISSHAPGYENVTGAPKLSRVAPQAEHWSVVMDAMLINSQSFAFNQSRVAGVPQGKVVAALDTGSLLSALPPAAVDAIYGSVPGAVYDNVTQGWLVPCDRSPNLTFVFGGQNFPVHPLDLTSPIVNSLPINDQWDTDVTECVNAFQYLAADPSSSGDGFDIILADVFLHNVYASFDYGDWHPTNNTDGSLSPFVQMTSTTDSTTMWKEFRTKRAVTLAQLPLPLDPASIVRYDGGSTPANSTVTLASSPAQAAEGDSTRAELSSAPSTGVAPSSSDDSWANKYGKVVLALLGANLVIGVLLLLAALAIWVRGRKGRILLANPVLGSGPVLLKGPVDA